MADDLKLTQLRYKAEEAAEATWAHYSKFQVLSVVETTDGKLYVGTNVENANYTLTVHAEQSAIIAAIHDGAINRCGVNFIKRIYVQSASEHSAPCGGCRQFINEFATKDCIWIGDNSQTGKSSSRPFEELLPLSFGPSDLGI